MERSITITKNIMPQYGKIAFYLRLSMADGDLADSDRTESNSIENQRTLLREYVQRITEISLGEEYDKDTAEFLSKSYLDTVVEYIDDGYSGTNFDRPAFRRMIEDAKHKEINTIIVKDTSRLGRDYIEVGDYMEQIFPLLGIRFIAVNSYYDSNDYRGTTLGLEMSITNLINSEYSKDLSRKIKSSRKAMWSKGIPTCGKAPFGYITQNKRYVIDPETAPYVRLIFDKALEGCGTRQIVECLNEKGVPTPGMFYKKRTGKSLPARVVSDDEYLWDTWMVHRVLKNYSYTGSMVQGKYMTVSMHDKRLADENDWIVLENTHPAIVTVDEWKAAQLVIKSRSKYQRRLSSDYILLGKIRCGTCGLSMEYKGSSILCAHSQSVGKKSKCCRVKHDAQKIVTIVSYELKRQIKILEHLELKIQEHRRKNSTSVDLSDLKKQVQTEIEILKAEKIRQYEAYAEGVISRDDYIKKKNEMADKMKKAEEKLHNAEQALYVQCSILTDIKETTSEFNRLLCANTSSQPITRKIVLAMIDSITVYDEKTMEIKFTFDDIGKRAVEYISEHKIDIGDI